MSLSETYGVTILYTDGKFSLTATEPKVPVKKDSVTLPVMSTNSTTTVAPTIASTMTLTPVAVANLMPPEYNKLPAVPIDPLGQASLIVTTASSIVSAPITMHPGFDLSMSASPPMPQQQQHSSNGFPHVPSISAVQATIKEEPSSPLGGYNNGIQMATGVPSIFDPVPANSLATTVVPSQAIKKEEKPVLLAVVQPTAYKPVGDGESAVVCVILICMHDSQRKI
jgi:hypothetical protein